MTSPNNFPPNDSVLFASASTARKSSFRFCSGVSRTKYLSFFPSRFAIPGSVAANDSGQMVIDDERDIA